MAEEEERKDPDNYRDHWLRVSVSVSGGSPFAVILRYDLGGGLDGYFRARWVAAATDVGVVLGFPRGVALEKFMALVVQYVAEHPNIAITEASGGTNSPRPCGHLRACFGSIRMVIVPAGLIAFAWRLRLLVCGCWTR